MEATGSLTKERRITPYRKIEDRMRGGGRRTFKQRNKSCGKEVNLSVRKEKGFESRLH